MVSDAPAVLEILLKHSYYIAKNVKSKRPEEEQTKGSPSHDYSDCSTLLQEKSPGVFPAPRTVYTLESHLIKIRNYPGNTAWSPRLFFAKQVLYSTETLDILGYTVAEVEKGWRFLSPEIFFSLVIRALSWEAGNVGLTMATTIKCI